MADHLTRRDFDKAKKLIAEAGYKGERVVVMDAVDQPVSHLQALVTADLLKKLRAHFFSNLAPGGVGTSKTLRVTETNE